MNRKKMDKRRMGRKMYILKQSELHLPFLTEGRDGWERLKLETATQVQFVNVWNKGVKNTFKTQYQSQVCPWVYVYFSDSSSLEFISRSISRAFKKKPKLFNSADYYSNIGSLDWPICTHPVGLGFPRAPRVTRWEILDLVVATDRLVQRSGAGTVAVTGGNQAAEFISEEYKDKLYLS